MRASGFAKCFKKRYVITKQTDKGNGGEVYNPKNKGGRENRKQRRVDSGCGTGQLEVNKRRGIGGQSQLSDVTQKLQHITLVQYKVNSVADYQERHQILRAKQYYECKLND